MLHIIKRYLGIGSVNEFPDIPTPTLPVESFNSFIVVNGNKRSLNGNHVPVCLDPLQICILDADPLPEIIEIIYEFKDKVIATVTCCYSENRDKNGSTLIRLYKIRSSSITNPAKTSLAWQWKAHKSKLGFRQYFQLAALYHFPRKVILVSARCDDFVNVFPMDLCLADPEKNIVVLGLRNTNKTNLYVHQENFRLSIGYFDGKHKNDAYFFGRFHSKQFPRWEKLPYQFLETPVNRNFFPDFVTAYSELKFSNCLQLGSQNLLIFHFLNAEGRATETKNSLHHIHGLAPPR